MYAAGTGIPFDSVKIKVKGSIDERGSFNVAQVPTGFLEVDNEVDIKALLKEVRLKSCGSHEFSLPSSG